MKNLKSLYQISPERRGVYFFNYLRAFQPSLLFKRDWIITSNGKVLGWGHWRGSHLRITSRTEWTKAKTPILDADKFYSFILTSDEN